MVLGPEFYSQDTAIVARLLIGKILVSTKGGHRTSGRIVETEAYLGMEDEASHSWRGPSARNSVMFGPAGHIYVYFIYGMHYCLNIVTGPPEVGEAVLLRALEPLEGLGAMQQRRGTELTSSLASGPAKLVQALGVDISDNGTALEGAEELWLEDDGTEQAVSSGPRIGISRSTHLPLRFWATGSPFVSKRGTPG
jgi:DNA-3-methyladenine glycosylase